MAVNADSIFEHRDPIRKPGWRKALPWIVAIVAIGVIVGFIGWKYSNTGHSTATPLTNQPANDVSKNPQTVKLPPGATRVARRFIETADEVQYAPMKIDYSYPKEALIEVALLPKKGAKVRGLLFQMNLVKRSGKWLVNSWTPKSSPPVPSGSENSGGGG